VENRLDNRAKTSPTTTQTNGTYQYNQRQRQLDAKTKRLNQQKNS